MTPLSAKQYQAMQGGKKRNKYGNRKTVRHGITFDSKAEADYYDALKLRERAGEVYEVERQRPYALTIDGRLICTYKADYVFYDDIAKRTRVVDVKGVETDVFVIKRKLMKAIHNIDVEVVKA